MENYLIVDQLKFNYSGLFSMPDLYRLIDSWFYEKGWDKWELRNYEIHTPTGKQIELELKPWIRYKHYYRHIIHIKFLAKNVKDVEIEKDGKKTKIQHGDIQIIFNAYLQTDYEGAWFSKWLFFVNILFDKYIFKHYFDRHKGWLIQDTYALRDRIKSYLNAARWKQ